MITFFNAYLLTAVLILGLMTLLWGLSLLLHNTSIIDIFWGLGFVLAVWLYFALTPEGASARKWLVASLATIWGLRLSLYLLWRNWGRDEDWRYQAFRKQAGSHWWWRSLLVVFWLQGVLMWLISAPLLAAQLSPVPNQLTWLDYAGVLLWGVGFFFEAVGDWQLARFKANPANHGALLAQGVWRYSRHPNYFGDAAQWWGFFLIAAAAPSGFLTLLSPIIMTVLLLRISGVTLLEKKLRVTASGYDVYVATTSPFVPWFVKRDMR